MEGIPKPVDSPDFGDLREWCVEYVEQLAEYGDADGYDWKIYRKVMEAVYGKEIWGWVKLHDRHYVER